MEVTLTIPDDVADQLQNASMKPLPRLLLELLAIKAYELDLITIRHVQEMLGFESRWEVDALFKAYDVRDHSLTMEELERGRATMNSLFGK